ncbi:PTS system galactose-specific transporter subunit IIB [Streptococcus pneumoniae]|nr:PTS system galactose-specific transporter subunit IIB [Streptococcus pneumoniae]
MIKILAACGAGVNSSHQIKSALEEELSNRGYDVHCDAVMVKDVNEDLMSVPVFDNIRLPAKQNMV